MVDEELKCLNCGGSVSPDEEKCSYCGYYNGAFYKNKRNPQPQPEPTEEEEKSAPSYYSSSHSSNGMGMLRQVVFFAVVLMVVTVLGTTFTNGTIQADFMAGAILAASMLGIILFLGAVKLVQL